MMFPGQANAELSGQPPPEEGMASKLANLALQMVQSPAIAQGMALKGILEQVPKLFKAEKTVPALAPKMTATTPFAPPVGRADQSALMQMQAARMGGQPGGQTGGGMPGGMPGCAPGGGLPAGMPGAMPGGAPEQPGGGGMPAQLLAMLARARGGM